jgi:hypothetical protein
VRSECLFTHSVFHYCSYTARLLVGIRNIGWISILAGEDAVANYHDDVIVHLYNTVRRLREKRRDVDTTCELNEKETPVFTKMPEVSFKCAKKD